MQVVLKAFDGAPTSYVAYALATVYHETAGTMQPIKERGSRAYFTRLYDVQGQNPERARRYGNTAPGDGPKYCGRGYVQLTWKNNYRKAGNAIGVDLVNNPDLAMKPDIAAIILREGMVEGWFTGRSLRDCFPGDKGTVSQFIRARGIINGSDRAVEISKYALLFQDALNAARYSTQA